MRKRTKLIIAVSGLCLVWLVAGWLLPLIGFVWLAGRVGGKHDEAVQYTIRPVECAPEELIPDLEKMFDIDFPKDIREVKTAKTIPMDGVIWFIVRFTAEPHVVDAFVKSFRRGVGLVNYDPEWDMRNTISSFTPAWFTKSIRQGKMGDIPGHGQKEICIDTTNEKEFVVYFHGFDGKELMDRKRQPRPP